MKHELEEARARLATSETEPFRAGRSVNTRLKIGIENGVKDSSEGSEGSESSLGRLPECRSITGNLTVDTTTHQRDRLDERCIAIALSLVGAAWCGQIDIAAPMIDDDKSK